MSTTPNANPGPETSDVDPDYDGPSTDGTGSSNPGPPDEDVDDLEEEE